MYTKEENTLFIRHTVYFKNGRRIAEKDENGKIHLVSNEYRAPVAMTRSQAYRYWMKHFPKKHCRSLPLLMSIATDIDPHEEAEMCYYQTADGEIFKGYR